MIVFKLLGHMDYGRTNKDWMFPGLFVYKHLVFKRGEGDKKVATIKGGTNSKYGRVLLGSAHAGKLGDLEICCLKRSRRGATL